MTICRVLLLDMNPSALRSGAAMAPTGPSGRRGPRRRARCRLICVTLGRCRPTPALSARPRRQRLFGRRPAPSAHKGLCPGARVRRRTGVSMAASGASSGDVSPGCRAPGLAPNSNTPAGRLPLWPRLAQGGAVCWSSAATDARVPVRLFPSPQAAMPAVPRVNGAMLAGHQGKLVTLVGKITSVSGSTLTLEASVRPRPSGLFARPRACSGPGLDSEGRAWLQRRRPTAGAARARPTSLATAGQRERDGAPAL